MSSRFLNPAMHWLLVCIVPIMCGIAVSIPSIGADGFRAGGPILFMIYVIGSVFVLMMSLMKVQRLLIFLSIVIAYSVLSLVHRGIVQLSDPQFTHLSALEPVRRILIVEAGQLSPYEIHQLLSEVQKGETVQSLVVSAAAGSFLVRRKSDGDCETNVRDLPKGVLRSDWCAEYTSVPPPAEGAVIKARPAGSFEIAVRQGGSDQAIATVGARYRWVLGYTPWPISLGSRPTRLWEAGSGPVQFVSPVGGGGALARAVRLVSGANG